MIHSIEVNNFRGLAWASLEELNPAVLMLGYNGQGKTSLLDAVRYCLTGQVYGQDGKRIVAKDLIGPHDRNATVRIGIEDLYLECRVNSTGSKMRAVDQAGNDVLHGSPDEIRAALWRRLKVNPRFVQPSCHPRPHLLGGDCMALLSQLADTVEHDRVVGLCGEHQEWFLGFLERMQLTIQGLDDLKRIGKAAYDERTGVQRECKNLKTLVADIERTPAPTGPDGLPLGPDSSPLVEQQLTQLRSKRDQLQRELGAAQGRRPADVIAQELEAVKQQIAELGVVDLESAEKEYNQAVATFQKITAERTAAEHDVKVAVDQVNTIKAALHEAERATENCRTCGQPLPNRMTAKRQIADLKKELKTAESKKSKAQKKLDKVKKDLRDFDAIVEPVQAARDKARAAQSDMARLVAKVEALEAEEPGDDITELVDRISEMDDRLNKGQALLATLSRLAEAEQHRAKIETLEAEVENLNWCVAAFRDGEVTRQLSSDIQAQFVARVNERLLRHGYVLAVQHDELCMGREGQAARPLTEVSDGELLLAQLAVCETYNAGFAVIDGLDGLDGRHKLQITQDLAELGGVLVAGAWGMGTKPNLDGVAGAIAPASLVWVENGTARLV